MLKSDNVSYRTLAEEMCITLHNTLGGSVANNGWKLKKGCPIILADLKTDQKPKELNRDRN